MIILLLVDSLDIFTHFFLSFLSLQLSCKVDVNSTRMGYLILQTWRSWVQLSWEMSFTFLNYIALVFKCNLFSWFELHAQFFGFAFLRAEFTWAESNRITSFLNLTVVTVEIIQFLEFNWAEWMIFTVTEGQVKVDFTEYSGGRWGVGGILLFYCILNTSWFLLLEF